MQLEMFHYGNLYNLDFRLKKIAPHNNL